MYWVKRVGWVALAAAMAMLVLLVAGNLWVVWSTESRILQQSQVPADNSVALVLGTSYRQANGEANPFFQNRMRLAARLYQEGKVSHFIVSGDNRSRYYNEPIEMQRALVSMGVPASVITLDYAGLRTLDSIVRSKEIFGQSKITIITQSFHCYRALFISNYFQVEAVAIPAEEPTLAASYKTRVREYFARAKAILDLYVLKTEPRHLGRKEPVITQ